MDPDYELFATVVETGSLSAAGRALLVSPAMVSKRLARLEARLGVRLLHRTTRKLALSEAGERFHGDVLGILRAIRDAEERLTGVRNEPIGILRISVPTSFGRLHVAPHLQRFLSAYPKVELEVDLSDANADLFVGRVDLAVRIASDIPASLNAHRLCGSRRILCASPAYLTAHGVPDTVAALARHRLLAATGQMPWRLVNAHKRHTVDRQSHVRTNSSELVRELALSGVGIALRSLWDVNDALRDRLLVPVLPGWEGPSDLGIFAVYPRASTPTPAVTAFVNFLVEQFNPPPWEIALSDLRHPLILEMT